MARKPREQIPGATYHVYSRCLQWADLMEQDYFKALFLDVILQAKEIYTFDLCFYEIMDNHFHLVIKTREGEANISRIMQYIKARFAEKYNRTTNRIGPFWNERFKDVIVENQGKPLHYFLWLLWYLAFNPVRKKRVADPRDYKFGSINQYLNPEKGPCAPITLHEYFQYLGNTFQEKVATLLLYEEYYRRKRAVFW